MKKILLTGARGYIGQALSYRLAEDGYSLRLVSRSVDPRSPSEVPRNIEWVAADLRQAAVWRDLISDCYAIIHLSHHTDLRAAEADEDRDADINVTPVRALISALASGYGNRPIVLFASTVTIVGCAQVMPVNELIPDNPISVYDRHKLVCEQSLAKATQRGLMRACSLRLSNVYGCGTASSNSNRGILNSMLVRALAGQTITLFGDGRYIRDFIHLEDAINAFRLALAVEKLAAASHYVIASGQGTTLRDAFEIIAEETHALTGRRVEIRILPEPGDLHPIERRNFVGDPKLFRKLTGWSPEIDLRTGIRRALSQLVTRGDLVSS